MKYYNHSTIPVLIDLLQEELDKRDKEGIVRALSIKEAKGIANKALLSEYRKLSNEVNMNSLKWSIGNAFETIITKDDISEIIPIVLDKSNGTSRQMFVHALGRIKSEDVENVLLSLLNDEDVFAHAIIALGRMKSKKSKEIIESYLNHSKSFVRREAKKALKKIG